MSDSFLEKLKKTVIAGAHTSATKIEEAARIGKLRLDLMAERRKLNQAYTELGKEAHIALLEGGIEQLAIRPGVGELQHNIERSKKEIFDLETRLAQVQRKVA
jgi:hypothetical protein